MAPSLHSPCYYCHCFWNIGSVFERTWLLFLNRTPHLALLPERCPRAALRLLALLRNPYCLSTEEPADWFSCSRLLALTPFSPLSWSPIDAPCTAVPDSMLIPECLYRLLSLSRCPCPRDPPRSPVPTYEIIAIFQNHLIVLQSPTCCRGLRRTFITCVIWGLLQWGVLCALRRFPKCRPHTVLLSASIRTQPTVCGHCIQPCLSVFDSSLHFSNTSPFYHCAVWFPGAYHLLGLWLSQVIFSLCWSLSSSVEWGCNIYGTGRLRRRVTEEGVKQAGPDTKRGATPGPVSSLSSF